MTNAELIKALRCESVINDEHPRCESCKYGVVVCHGSREDVYGCDSRRIENDAADALEAAEKRITELEAKMPTVDAVPVVRCAQCKWWWKVNGLCTHPKHCHDNVCVHECGKDYFCADGERRSNGK